MLANIKLASQAGYREFIPKFASHLVAVENHNKLLDSHSIIQKLGKKHDWWTSAWLGLAPKM